jgi:hypothetical protein
MKYPIYEVLESDGIPITIVRKDADGSVWSIPSDLSNKDYQEYLASLEATEPNA